MSFPLLTRSSLMAFSCSLSCVSPLRGGGAGFGEDKKVQERRGFRARRRCCLRSVVAVVFTRESGEVEWPFAACEWICEVNSVHRRRFCCLCARHRRGFGLGLGRRSF